MTNMEQDPNNSREVRRRNLTIGTAAVGLVVLAVLVLIVWLWKRSGAETEAEVTPVVSVKVVTAERGEIAAQYSAVGTIWPRENTTPSTNGAAFGTRVIVSTRSTCAIWLLGSA